MTACLAKEVDEFVNDMKSSNSNLDKQDVFLKKIKNKKTSAEFVELLKLIYNEQLKFNITSKNIIKFESTKYKSEHYKEYNLLTFIKLLVDAKLTGHNALKAAVSILTDFPDYRETLLCIFNKDLRIRFGLKQANKVVPNFVQDFNVSLGNAYNEKTKKHLEKGEWFISKKLDGVRCVTFINIASGETKIEFYSRQGLKFHTLREIEEDICIHIVTKMREHNLTEIVLDGEMCVIKEDGSEDFKLIMKEIRKKNHIVANPKYLVFDLLIKDEFNKGISTKKRYFSNRLNLLKKILPTTEHSNGSTNKIQMIPQHPFSEKTFAIITKKSEDEGWEGLMLRKDDVYRGKRSNDLLKVKNFETEEYKVKDVCFGDIMVINEVTGLQETIETLVSVVIEHEGINKKTKKLDKRDINVGSGFSQRERRMYYDDPKRIKGKVISVQFFEKSYSKDGKESLRFPTFKGVHGEKREI